MVRRLTTIIGIVPRIWYSATLLTKHQEFVFRRNTKTGAFSRATGLYSDAYARVVVVTPHRIVFDYSRQDKNPTTGGVVHQYVEIYINGGKQSPPVSGQQLNPISPISV